MAHQFRRGLYLESGHGSAAALPCPDSRRGITWKGLVVGLVFCLFLAWWAAYGEMIIHASPMANDYSAPVSVFLFFVVAAGLNPILGRLGPRWPLGRADLTAVFVILLTAAAIPTRGFVSMIGPVVTGASYYATAENRWSELVLPHVQKQDWIVPRGPEIVRAYYEGLPPGDSIPWRAWSSPVLAWLALCLALSAVMVCLAVLFRKQWVERERIVFPMMQLPLEFVRSGEPGAPRPIWRSKLLWAGFAVPFIVYSYQGFAYYYKDYLVSFDLAQTIPLFHGETALYLRFSPISFALLYFCRSDMLLGLSIFPLVLSLLKGWTRTTGSYPFVPKLGIWSYDPVEAFFGAGALLVFVARILYFARSHLKSALAAALGIGPRADDSEEILSYRGACIGLLLGGSFLVVWLVRAGMTRWEAVLYLGLAFIIFMALARVIAEAGLPTALPPVVAGDFLVGLVGSSALSPSNLTAIGFTYPFHAEMRCFLLSHAANGLKVTTDSFRGPKRRLFWAILLGVAATYLVAMSLMIYFPYRDGALNLDKWTFTNTAQYSWLDASRRITEARGPVSEGFSLMAAGAALMVVLLLAAHWIPQWPIHPGALVVTFHWSGNVLWFSAVAALAVKAAILKYGGPRIFTESRPFFYGLILGEVVTAALWVILDGLTGVRGNYITSFF
ncbi:MAG: hypothetical protein HYU36_14475 [Planctomycetes bacterium]|nr:hypothetical protein [Planctomycetota bacterium]